MREKRRSWFASRNCLRTNSWPDANFDRKLSAIAFGSGELRRVTVEEKSRVDWLGCDTALNCLIHIFDAILGRIPTISKCTNASEETRGYAYSPERCWWQHESQLQMNLNDRRVVVESSRMYLSLSASSTSGCFHGSLGNIPRSAGLETQECPRFVHFRGVH